MTNVTAQGGIENTGPFIQGNINATVTITGTSSTPLVAAQPTGIRTFITTIQVVNSSASTNAHLTITDGTSTIYLPAPAASGNSFHFGISPFTSIAATAVTVTASASVTSLLISCVGYSA